MKHEDLRPTPSLGVGTEPSLSEDAKCVLASLTDHADHARNRRDHDLADAYDRAHAIVVEAELVSSRRQGREP